MSSRRPEVVVPQCAQRTHRPGTDGRIASRLGGDIRVRPLYGGEHIAALSGESSGVFSGTLRSLDHAAQQEGVLAMFGDRQRAYRLGAAAARRQGIEQVSWHSVITHVPPDIYFPRSSSRPAPMV